MVTSDGGEEDHQLLGTIIAAGDLLNMQVVSPLPSPLAASLANTQGTITSRDLAGSAWKQGFTFTRDAGVGIDVQLAEPIQHMGVADGTVAPPGAGMPGGTSRRL